MEETGNNLLDPRAEEFRPRNHLSQMMMTTQTFIHQPQPQIYYQYPSSGVQVIPLCQQSPSPAYFRPTGPPPPPPLLHPPPETVATRSLLLSYVPVEVNEDIVRREMEVFGEVRSVEMERLVGEGIVSVHFYDLRQAVGAIMEIQSQHMKQQNRLRHHFNCWGFLAENCVPIPVPPPSHGLIAGKAVWAQFISPSSSTVNGLPDWRNQGTIVILNLDAGVSVCRLKEIFEAFGPVKEVRETPLKKHQRFVEYFDIRDAARALLEMDGKEINGQFVTIQFSRPGGNRRRISSISPPPSSSSINRTNSFYTRLTSNPPPLPSKLFRRSNSNSSSSNSSSQSHQHVKKSGFGSRGISTNSNNYNNGSRSRRFSGIESSMGSLSLGVSGNVFSEEDQSSFNGGSSSSSSRRHGKNDGDKQAGMMMMKQPRARSWKNHQRLLMKNPDTYFLIKDDAIMADSNTIRDPRTTVMIKNIPNKYSQKLLLNMLDNHCIHCNEQITDGDDQYQPLSAYDFVYLPIDFNNKCNVGYGFVNMTSPQATLRLYKAFHLQQWEVFNSRKICEVTYARLQGLEALKEHFKNSKFACETDDYLPVVFSPPRDGKQLTDPIPMGGHSQDGCSKMKILLNAGSGGSSSCNSTTTSTLKGGDNEEWVLDEMNDEKKDYDNGGVMSSFKGGSCGYDIDDDDEKTQLIPKVAGVLMLGKKKKKIKSAELPNGCLASSSEPQQQHSSRPMLL